MSGYAIAPRDPAEAMIAKADASFQASRSLLGPRGFRTYVSTIYRAMVEAWTNTRDMQLITVEAGHARPYAGARRLGWC